MASTESTPQLDPRLRGLLNSLRSRIRRYIVLDALLAAAVLVLIAFWTGLLIDYLPVRVGGTEMPRSARALLLVATGVALLVLAVRLLGARLLRPLPDASLALLLERRHPELGERLITAVELQRVRREGDLHHPALLAQVHRQAVELAEGVKPSGVLRRGPLGRKAAVAAPLLLAMVAFAILAPDAFGRASSRLLLLTDQPWPRQADLQMVGVEVPRVTLDEETSGAAQLLEFDRGVVRVARGGAATLRVRARAEGAVVPDLCTVYYRSDSGVRGQVNMRRIGRIQDGFQQFLLDGPPLEGLSESLQLTIRGLDDRLDNYRIEAIEPPAVTGMQIQGRYPDYLRRPEEGEGGAAEADDAHDLVTGYQPGLRLREGSHVEMIGRSSKPLGAVQAVIAVGNHPRRSAPVRLGEDGLSFELSLGEVREPTTVVVLPSDPDAIAAQSPYRYFLGVVADQPPEMDLRLRGIGTAVTPLARLPIEGTARDDYALVRTAITLSVADAEAGGEEQAGGEGEANPAGDSPGPSPPRSITRPVTPSRTGEYATVLDLRDLAADGQLALAEPEGQLYLYGEATDGYDLDGQHVTRTEMLRLELVSADDLLARLERRELALRSRLEQIIDETQGLRETLDRLYREGWAPPTAGAAGGVAVAAPQEAQGDAAASRAVEIDGGDPQAEPDEAAESGGDPLPDAPDRSDQLRRLRIQQAGLQASKTMTEVAGVAESIDDILEEMINNRVDSVDRRERMASAIRDPLRAAVDGPLTQLNEQMDQLLEVSADRREGPVRTRRAVQTTEEVLIRLNEVLESMLQLESYNELLDLVRDLIDNQEQLIDATRQEQRQKVLDLFE